MPTEIQAPELRVAQWIDSKGEPTAPITLDQLGASLKVIFCFQHWCPGCHSQGFPALQRLVSVLEPQGVGFAVVQTVFEGFDENTFERLRENQQRYALELPFGHDSILGHYSTFMEDYETRGTPWFVFINEQNHVVYSDFHVDVDQVLASFEQASRG